MATTKELNATHEYPDIFQRYVDEINPEPMDMPRRTTRRFHGRDVVLWQGYVHLESVEGYVENLRLRFYLNQWRSKQQNPNRDPSTDEVYEIMVGADQAEKRDSDKPFQIERMSDSIVRNNVREPIIVHYIGDRKTELWDGNRRFFGTKHIMTVEREEYAAVRNLAQWVPAYVYLSSGDTQKDVQTRHDILVECNFVDPEQIPWPAYVKAEQVHKEFERRMKVEPDDPALSRQVKAELASEFGLKGWRTADRWIKMYDLAVQFKEYQEEEQERDPALVDLQIQERFEYFDELSKPGVFGSLKNDPDARDEVFDWMWDGKFKAWIDVRQVPKILADPVARKQANVPDQDGVKQAIATIIANDPVRAKDKTAANERIKQFAMWLDSFKREEYKTINTEALGNLKSILNDVVKITDALISEPAEPEEESASVTIE